MIKVGETKIVIIDGKKYLAEKVGFANPKIELPRRATEDYQLPKHTSLFVKTLESVMDEKVKELALKRLAEGDTKMASELLKKGKIAWMRQFAVNFDSITKQIIGRLP